ncbi:(2Fe-2S)-binding protein [soil metagenome]
MSTHRLRFTLNGRAAEREVPADRLLLDLLREDLTLTGTKEGCGIGVCGLCSVLVDDEVLSACLLPAVLVDGRSVVTIEGLADRPGGTALQDAFIAHGGFQCGICTPGQLISASALLAASPRAEEAEVREWMKGNLCRCTGYYGILHAIAAARPAAGADR